MTMKKQNTALKRPIRIALIGARGSGKTKISLMLARRLRLPLLSLDTLIQYEHGLTIPQIVERQGWAFFRDAEYQCLQKAAALPELILDCGGGVVVDLDQQDQEVMSERKLQELKGFTVIYLDAPLQEVKKKILGDKDRPSLSDEVTADDIFHRRLPWYKQAADFTVPLDKKHRKKAVKKILENLL